MSVAATTTQRRRFPSLVGGTTAPGPNTNRLGLAAIAGLLVLFFALRHESFLTAGNAETIAVNMSAVAIAAVGAAALLATGNVDLSIGGMYAFIGMVVAQVAANVANPVAAVAAGLALGLVLGALNGTLVRLLKISPLIVTIGLLAVYGGLAFVVSPDFVFGFSESFIELGRGELASIPYPAWVAAIVMVVGGLVLTRTVLGLHLYAIGGDRRAAERAGVRAARIVLGAYTVNGLLVGAVAILTTAQLGSGAPTLGVGFEFDVLTAVILGGFAFAGGAGRPVGLLIGVVTIGILRAGLIFEGLDHWYQEIAKGGILLLALGADQITAARRDRKASRGDGARRPTAMEAPSLAAPVSEAGEPSRNGAASTALAAGPVTLATEGLGKRYGAVQALEGASLTLHAGEVIALLGDNGAGKSTLVKIISGAVRPDAGRMTLDGKPLDCHDPADARAAGVETVYQDLALCPNLSVVHNLMLGNEPTRRWLGVFRVRDDATAEADAIRRLGELSIRLPDPSVLVEALSGGQRQAIAVARAVDEHVRVVCLDEPTAALGVAQTEQVLALVRSAARRGTSVVIITHDVASVLRVSDRVVVLRHGTIVHDGPTADLGQLELMQLMAGLDPVSGEVAEPGEVRR
ncbi:MAG: ATP-binding cassette domain-containing protein [Solirubrobacterales bacterium]|nr:ATP-binding cassette domain-containing protein [Solirubrobacterales bacterium]